MMSLWSTRSSWARIDTKWRPPLRSCSNRHTCSSPCRNTCSRFGTSSFSLLWSWSGLQQPGHQLEPSSVHMWLFHVQLLSQWTEVTSSLLQAGLSFHVNRPGPTHEVAAVFVTYLMSGDSNITRMSGHVQKFSIISQRRIKGHSGKQWLIRLGSATDSWDNKSCHCPNTRILSWGKSLKIRSISSMTL